MSEIIHLISGPRNISTALMYSFGNREDTSVVDEPFYAYYLKHFDVEHPGKAEIINVLPTDPVQVIEKLINNNTRTKYYFIKNMAHHLNGFDYSFTYEVRNIFLIRDPRQLIFSYAKVIKNPTTDDLGIKREWQLYLELALASSYPIVVVDSGELLKNPKKVISEMCNKLKIPYTDQMLSWKAGARKEDGIWAKYWYHNVHRSSTFIKKKEEIPVLSENLEKLYRSVKPYYDQLYQLAIKAK